MHTGLKNVVVTAGVLLAVACSAKVKLGAEHQHRYICNTGMVTADQGVLSQRFWLDLSEDYMSLKLQQTRPGDASLETYTYTYISDDTIKAINPAGLMATFSDKTHELLMQLSDTGPKISGKCVAQSK
jgi:hypothetical protein